MFTVKHTSPEWVDQLYAASGVRFEPARSAKASDPPETVWIRREDTGVEFPITDGVIYVMNNAGSTVAKYDLELKRRAPTLAAAA